MRKRKEEEVPATRRRRRAILSRWQSREVRSVKGYTGGGGRDLRLGNEKRRLEGANVLKEEEEGASLTRISLKQVRKEGSGE